MGNPTSFFCFSFITCPQKAIVKYYFSLYGNSHYSSLEYIDLVAT